MSDSLKFISSSRNSRELLTRMHGAGRNARSLQKMGKMDVVIRMPRVPARGWHGMTMIVCVGKGLEGFPQRHWPYQDVEQPRKASWRRLHKEKN